jgi:hypothetical protein
MDHRQTNPVLVDRLETPSAFCKAVKSVSFDIEGLCHWPVQHSSIQDLIEETAEMMNTFRMQQRSLKNIR